MKINFMRIADYWVGKPLCLILSIIPAIKGLGRGRDSEWTLDNRDGPEKVLFIKLFGIGSIILSYPAVKAFKERFPLTRCYYLTFASNRGIIEILGLAEDEDIITIRDNSIITVLIDAVRALRRIKREAIPVTVDFEFFSRFTAIFAYLSGAVKRVGFYNYHTEGLSRGKVINVPVSYNHTKHTSEVFSHLTEALGAAEAGNKLPAVDTGSPPLSGELGEFRLKIIFNTGSSDLISLRSWTKEHFSRLAELTLDAYPDAAVIFTGTRGEKKTVKALIEGITDRDKGERIFDLSGETTLRELIALFSASDIIVTIDSGTAHMASLTDTAIIDLFGPETPALYGPLSVNSTNVYMDLACQPCISVFNGKHSHCTDNICMQQITPEAVLELIKESL